MSSTLDLKDSGPAVHLVVINSPVGGNVSLKACPSLHDWGMQVTIDKEGLIKVTHMLSIDGNEVPYRTQVVLSGQPDTQRNALAASRCVIQFVIVSELELNEE